MVFANMALFVVVFFFFCCPYFLKSILMQSGYAKKQIGVGSLKLFYVLSYVVITLIC